MREPTAIEAWDKEYLKGKYQGDEAIPFAEEILDTLSYEGLLRGAGLYVGCGNGRNYIPLVSQGLQLTGLDISGQALEQLSKRNPLARPHLVQGDFLDFESSDPLDYLISIQVFQHGDIEKTRKYFDKTGSILRSGGLFFLRVNSVNTDVLFNNTPKEGTEEGGITITYTDGPKEGLDVHFYSEKEIRNLTKDFSIVLPPHEVTMRRESPQKGQWTQWEGIWRKK